MPFVERRLQGVHTGAWKEKAAKAVVEEKVKRDILSPRTEWGTQSLLMVMGYSWNEVFKPVLGHAEGLPDNVVRTVTENAKTVEFKTQGFEEK